jgi:catechol 2,3-dioxygenase-like lactoylglutathione lyase family enzyme
MDSAPAPSPAPLHLSAIRQIALTVTQLDRAIAFYRDTLGMKLLFQVPNMGFFDCGEVRLMLTGSEKPGDGQSFVVYFKVPDIQQTFQAMMVRGVTFDRDPHLLARMPDHDLWMAFFRDPDRNLLALMSEVPRGGK